MTGAVGSAGPAGSSGGGGSSAKSTAALALLPGALSISTPSLSAADLPLAAPIEPRSRAAVARFLVKELCLCIGGGGVARLSEELCTGSVLITSLDDLTVTELQKDTLSRLGGFAWASWSEETPDEELSPSSRSTVPNSSPHDFDDLRRVRIFCISSTENECCIELDPELLPLKLRLYFYITTLFFLGWRTPITI